MDSHAMHPTDRRVKAGFRATMATCAGAVLLLIPGVNVILFIGLMLPLWMIGRLGVPGLGHELNGFFIPSPIGWTMGAIIVWSIFLYAFNKSLKKA